MKRISTAVALLALVVMNCGDSAGPDSSEPDPQPSTVIASETIGPEGGSLTGTDITVTVPAGAVTSDAELTLSVADPTVFDAYSVTDMYSLSGITEPLGIPLTMRVKYSGNVSGGACIALGGTPAGKTGVVMDRYVPAVADNGFLVAEIGPGTTALSAGKAADGDTPENALLFLMGITSYETEESLSGRLTLSYPTYVQSLTRAMGERLETAWADFETMGFRFVVPGQTEYAVEKVLVTAKDFEESWIYGDKLDEFAITDIRDWRDTPWYVNPFSFVIDLNLGMLDESHQAMMRPWSGRLLADFILFANSGVATDDNGWVYYAFPLWAEHHMAEDAAWIPEGYADAAPLALAGAARSYTSMSGTDRIAFGRSMSSLMTYLSDLSSPAAIAGMFGDVLAGSGALDALVARITTPVREWWPAYAAALVEGSIYPVDTGAFLATAVDGGMITSNTDVTISRTGSYPALSGKLHRFDLAAAGMEDSHSVTFQASGTGVSGDDITLTAYAVDGADLEPLVHGPAVQVAELEELAIAGKDIAVLVTHAGYEPGSTDAASITLTAQVSGIPTYTSMNISITHVWRHFSYTDPSKCGTPFTESTATDFGTAVSGGFTGSVFSGQKFTHTESGLYGRSDITTTVEVTVSPDHSTASFAVTWMQVDLDEGTVSVYTYSGEDIPRDPEDPPGAFSFKVTGLEETAARLQLTLTETYPDRECVKRIDQLQFYDDSGAILRFF